MYIKSEITSSKGLKKSYGFERVAAFFVSKSERVIDSRRGSALLVFSADTQWSTIAVEAIEELLFKVKWTERRKRLIVSLCQW